MIIHFKGEHNQDEYVVCPPDFITVEELLKRMLQRAKVIEGSYAYHLINDLHSSIFVQSLDLKADYETYFSREYGSFSEYLRRRERLPFAVVTKLSKRIDISCGMYYFQPWHAFLSDRYGLEFLTQLLEDLPE